MFMMMLKRMSILSTEEYRSVIFKFSKNNLEINGRNIEAVLLLLEGDIDLNKISKLTDQMNLPGGKQLKKAQQKKAL